MMAELAETDQIEQDLARTRARMDSRLDELQDHLSPKQMLNDAFAYFRGGEGADFTQDLVARAKANPMPVALVGVGLAWLMASHHSRSPAPPAQHDDFEARIRHAESDVVRAADEHDDAYHGRLDDARGKVLGIARGASDTAATYTRRIKDALASASQSALRTSHDLAASASDTLGQLGDAVGERGSAIQKGTQTMARSTRDTLSSITANPFALGGIAAVVGLIAGALLPTTEEEMNALGPVATKLRATGKDLAQDVVDRGGRVATDTIAAIKDSADARGLTSDKSVGNVVKAVQSGDLIGDVKQVAREALQASKDSAQKDLADTKGAPQPDNP